MFQKKTKDERNAECKMQNAECRMQNSELLSALSSQLILLCRLFFLAARHSANKFALCTRSAASVLSSQFSVFRFPFFVLNSLF